MFYYLCQFDKFFNKIADGVAPVIDLIVRGYVASVFFYSGLTKTANWDSTLTLFKYEYNVPFIPSDVAAYLATGGELLLPVLLVLGFGSRVTPLALFILNGVAMISYPDISSVGWSDHVVWGLLLAMLIAHGHGKLSVDHLLRRYLC